MYLLYLFTVRQGFKFPILVLISLHSRDTRMKFEFSCLCLRNSRARRHGFLHAGQTLCHLQTHLCPKPLLLHRVNYVLWCIKFCLEFHYKLIFSDAAHILSHRGTKTIQRFMTFKVCLSPDT